MSDQIYCSVDLEFTGFDVTRDQILEIGFAFFRMTENGPEIIEEWSQVFKPSIEVHPKILGLTGITQEELDSAPEFKEHRDFLQEKLGDAIIVGHNPVMDVKFLEAYGIKLSGKTIDTLELVQFILPTHHSYNLENLMHYFGVAHEDAHRALGDCKTTISVLTALVRTYQQFSTELQTELQTIIARGNFLWSELLTQSLGGDNNEKLDSLSHLELDDVQPFEVGSNAIAIDLVGLQHEARVAKGLQSGAVQSLLVVSQPSTVMRLWKAGLVHGLFAPQDLFNPSAFEAFKAKAETVEELRFCMKVIVWQHTNWQTETVLDLNISFFGGQFRSFIVGGELQKSDAKVVACEYRALQYAAQFQPMQQRKLVVCDLQGFEKYISSGNDTKLSWHTLLYTLRLIYNPETNYGNQSKKDAVITTLIGVDLFFGLVYLLLHRSYPNLPYIDLQQVESEQPHIYRRLHRASQSLVTKLSTLVEESSIIDVKGYIQFLENFFASTSGRVRWILIDESNTTFHDQPLEIASASQQLLGNFTETTFTETITAPDLLSYYSERLGLNTEVGDIVENSRSINQKQLHVKARELNNENLKDIVLSEQLPLVLVLGNLIEVKEFYNQHYQEVKQSAAVFAQGYSGGGNKMFRNFSLKKNSVLVATADFIAKQSHQLNAKTIVFAHMPGIELNHPYVQALLKHWQSRFPQLAQLLSQGKLVEVIKKVSIDAELQVILYSKDAQADSSQLQITGFATHLLE